MSKKKRKQTKPSPDRDSNLESEILSKFENDIDLKE